MIFDLEKCCGCGSCVNICPTGAIQWTCNEEGFYEPKIDQDKCVNCGLCRKVCPYETNHVGIDAEPQVFAAVHRDRNVVRQSSSGGAFTALSDWILGQYGVIYGVKFDENYRVVYSRAETASQRNTFRGSKYVQCDGQAVFSQVESDLNEGRLVMFTGTPCQVSGLKQYLTVKKTPMDQLYLVDNLCHGAASPKVWQDYLEYIRANVLVGRELRHFSMRSKKEKWQKQFLDCETEQGDESQVLNDTASWNKLYRTTYATRKSCFQCRFTSYDRISDLTLADYWNIENAGLNIDYSDGVSLILVNTEKGRQWLEGAGKDMVLCGSDKKSCWQIHLERPAVYTAKREKFWQSYGQSPVDTIQKNMKGSRFNAFARALSPVLRKLGIYTLAVRILSVVKGNGKIQ